MQPDFRQHLYDYVSSLARAAGTRVRTDRAGKALSGAQLAARIKDVYEDLKTKRYDFSSPGKMAETLAQMREEKNRKAVETAKREHQQFVQQQDRGHRGLFSCLKLKPARMRRRLEEKRQELQDRCREELRGEDGPRQAALQELEEDLAKPGAQFLQAYEQRFLKKAVGLGLAIGGVVLGAVGAGVGVGVGAGVAAIVVAVEEAAAIGVGAGGLGAIGAAVGGWLGARFGRKSAENQGGTNDSRQGAEGQDRAGDSDREPLVQDDD
ncbi:RING finger protein 112-like [Pelodiscus sinensis]|uniref:RING finger protein 112-like n=1 Tax=Pelodiscus sinensis TaxID=13735 RepID=UPI003F6A5D3D